VAILIGIRDPLSFAREVRRRRARGILLLMGSEALEEDVVSSLSSFYGESVRIASPQEGNNSAAITWDRLERVLGISSFLVIVSARVALDANAVAAATGLIRAGGLLVVLLGRRKGNVPSSQGMAYGPPSPFVNFFLSSLRECEVAMAYDVDSGPLWVRLEWDGRGIGKARRGFTPTEGQKRVIEEMEGLADGRGGEVVIVRGDRGRGKSAALGLGLASLAKKGMDLVIVSRDLSSISVLLEFLEKKTGIHLDREEKYFKGRGFSLHWLPLDSAISLPASFADVVVVDEAAEFPVDKLMSMVRRFKRLVFSTTVHGYEGSGRGFERKFAEGVRREAHHKVVTITLEEPVRFLPGDPLERWAFEKLYLSPQLQTPDPKDLEFVELERDISQVGLFYPILAEAHYRNEPNDLAALMDLPDHSLVGLLGGGKPLAFAELALEGPLTQQQVDVVMGGGELIGDLIPDKLVGRSRMVPMGAFPGERVVRIAVHPDFQGRGFGSLLLSRLEERAQRQGMGWMGAAFSIDKQVLKFWFKNHYIPVYLSWKKVSSGGSFSVIVLKPLIEEVRQAVRASSDFVLWQWVQGISNSYRGMDPELMADLMIALGRFAPPASLPYKVSLELPLEAYPHLLAWAARAYASEESPKPQWLTSLMRFISGMGVSRTDRYNVRSLLEQLYAASAQGGGGKRSGAVRDLALVRAEDESSVFRRQHYELYR